MTGYPDTSFLYAFYLKQSHSPAAAAYAATMKEPLHLTELLRYEFLQSLRFQVWRHAQDPGAGIVQADADAAINQLESDLQNGIAVLATCNLMDTLRSANQISKRHTVTRGYRSFDILHVATALHLQAKEFLTFDANQRKLAVAEGLKPKP